MFARFAILFLWCDDKRSTNNWSNLLYIIVHITFWYATYSIFTYHCIKIWYTVMIRYVDTQ